MNQVKKFFGSIFVTKAYLATLSDAQVAERALGKRWAYVMEESRRDHAKAMASIARSTEEMRERTIQLRIDNATLALQTRIMVLEWELALAKKGNIDVF